MHEGPTNELTLQCAKYHWKLSCNPVPHWQRNRGEAQNLAIANPERRSVACNGAGNNRRQRHSSAQQKSHHTCAQIWYYAAGATKTASTRWPHDPEKVQRMRACNGIRQCHCSRGLMPKLVRPSLPKKTDDLMGHRSEAIETSESTSVKFQEVRHILGRRVPWRKARAEAPSAGAHRASHSDRKLHFGSLHGRDLILITSKGGLTCDGERVCAARCPGAPELVAPVHAVHALDAALRVTGQGSHRRIHT